MRILCCVFFKMGSCDANANVIAWRFLAGDVNPEFAIDTDRMVELGDLIALWQVRIEIDLAIEVCLVWNTAPKSKAKAYASSPATYRPRAPGSIGSNRTGCTANERSLSLHACSQRRNSPIGSVDILAVIMRPISPSPKRRLDSALAPCVARHRQRTCPGTA